MNVVAELAEMFVELVVDELISSVMPRNGRQSGSAMIGMYRLCRRPLIWPTYTLLKSLEEVRVSVG